MSLLFLTIDPGKTGAICAFFSDGNVSADPMPKTEEGVLSLLSGYAQSPICYLEKVGGYIGGEGQPGSAMFNFGHNYGFLRGVLRALGITIADVTPQTWQAGLKLGSTGFGSKKDRKKAYLEHARLKFPEIKVTLSLADALCIGLWAMGQSHTVVKKQLPVETVSVKQIPVNVSFKSFPLFEITLSNLQASEKIEKERKMTFVRDMAARKNAEKYGSKKPPYRPAPIPDKDGMIHQIFVPTVGLINPRPLIKKPPYRKADPFPHKAKIEALTVREQVALCEQWCEKQGKKMPKRGTPERTDMFETWYNLAINGEA